MKAIYAELSTGGTEVFVIVKDEHGNFYRVLGTPELLSPEHHEVAAIPGFHTDMMEAGVSAQDCHEIMNQLGY